MLGGVVAARPALGALPVVANLDWVEGLVSYEMLKQARHDVFYGCFNSSPSHFLSF